MVQLYYVSYTLLTATYRALLIFHSLLRAAFAGLWLGLLERDTLLKINERYYAEHQRYLDDDYNRRGLFAWERAMLERYFPPGERLLVVGAGGGREVLALRELGFEAHGLECNGALVAASNTLLETHGLPPCVRFAPPDTCPAGPLRYGGLIVGWGAYMLIQGRERRTALLREMRAQVDPGAPLLVSFFPRSPAARRFRVIAEVANGLRRLTGRGPLELGDDLEPEYVHYFTQEELAAELRAGGFVLSAYHEEPYGHAVARAV
jgi:hypothetical protein